MAKHVAVIGAGAAGLAAAYDLARMGMRVSVFEADDEAGGLARSLRMDGHSVERFYHFICRPDSDYVQFVRDLGLEDRLHWQRTRTSFFYNGRMRRFGSPLDLLSFESIPLAQRIRVGLHVLNSRYRKHWRWLDQIPAKAWLIESIGEEAYQAIWHPLLAIKFGDAHDQVSAAWVWHRIWRVAQSRKHMLAPECFGYLERGTATWTEHVVEWLRSQPTAAVRFGTAVRAIEVDGDRVRGVRVADGFEACDAVVSTVALPVLDSLLPRRTETYFENIRKIEYIGVVCALMRLKQPFSSNFWMNINDPRISFNGVIELTNLNQHLRRAGLNLLYVPYYVSTSDARYRMADQQLRNEYVSMLRIANPGFDDDWIKEWHVSRHPYAQAVCKVHFAKLVPALRSPIEGLYVSDSVQFYPEDRTVSAAIKQGRTIASMIAEGSACRA